MCDEGLSCLHLKFGVTRDRCKEALRKREGIGGLGDLQVLRKKHKIL